MNRNFRVGCEEGKSLKVSEMVAGKTLWRNMSRKVPVSKVAQGQLEEKQFFIVNGFVFL